MATYSSPGVYSLEKDATFYIRTEKSSAAAYVLQAKWGACNKILEVVDEDDLIKKTFTPDTNVNTYFLAALDYLSYASPLNIIRTAGKDAANAVSTEYAQDPDASTVRVLNDDQYEAFKAPTTLSFMGKYLGSLANGLKISVVDKDGFDAWEWKDYFQYIPEGDQISVAIIDTAGVITGMKNTVVESYELLSLKEGTLKFDNTPAYIKKVLELQSRYVLVGHIPAIQVTSGKFETVLQDGKDDYEAPDFDTAISVLSEVEDTDFMRAFTSFMPEAAAIKLADVCNAREDAICFRSPPLEAVYNTLDPADNVLKYFNETLNKQSTYAFNDDNWKLVPDKYNGTEVWIPCCSSTAGLHGRTIATGEAWQSPAGFNRGHLNNYIRLAWSANKPQRDRLYRSAVNSIVSFKGRGVVLYGDRMAWRQPSAFDRINVRTTFIILRKDISTSSEKLLFENNTFVTRKLFKSSTEQYLGSVQARGGLYDYRVVCDETNNTPAIIDRNEFIGDIFLKPVKSINWIILTFTAVNTGVDFDEYIQGTV